MTSSWWAATSAARRSPSWSMTWQRRSCGWQIGPYWWCAAASPSAYGQASAPDSDKLRVGGDSFPRGRVAFKRIRYYSVPIFHKLTSNRRILAMEPHESTPALRVHQEEPLNAE